MKSTIVLLFTLAVAVVYGRPEPPVSDYLSPYSTTQQDSFAPPPASPSSTYGAPSALSNTYGVPSAPLHTYGAPPTPSNIYGAPSAPATTYGAPGRGSISRSSFSSHRSGGTKSRFGSRAPSQTYGTPALTSAIFTPLSTKGIPSSTYGGPISNYAVPSSNYGTPSSNYRTPSSTHGAPAFGGYPASKYDASQDDLAEPAMYEFSYEVQDAPSGSDFGHREQREGDVAWGSYEVLLPDGRKQIVDYQADQDGYNPSIRYEDSGYPASKGAGGPY